MPTITFELTDTDMLLVQNPAVHAGAFCQGLVLQYITQAKREIIRQQIEVCTLNNIDIPPTQDEIVQYAFNGEFGFMTQQYQDMLQRQKEAAEKVEARIEAEAV